MTEEKQTTRENGLKRAFQFLTSMPFAIALLILLALACAGASMITQGQTLNWYVAQYGERTASLIMTLSLDDAFHSWWFILISAFLCLNLLFCNLIRLPQLISRTKNEKNVNVTAVTAAGVSVEGIEDAEKAFARLRMPKPEEGQDEEGRKILYASKNRIGLWGAWVCHLGILLLILGFSLGQFTKEDYAVYGVPGQTKPVGKTGLQLTIDDFEIGLREDDTVEQYTARITASNGAGREEKAEISVNHPARMFGMTFYQNSTGWAARIGITKDGQYLQDAVLCTGEFVPVKDKEDLIVYFNAFYPDYELVQGQGPMTRSGNLNNPAYLYTVYYRGEVLGMNVLMPDEVLTIDEYEVTFSEPQPYTVIQVKRDAFTPLAFAGGILVMLGLILAFYLIPVRVLARKEEDGTWTFYGLCQKGGPLFRERFENDLKELSHAAS